MNQPAQDDKIPMSKLEGMPAFEVINYFLQRYESDTSFSSVAEVDGLVTAMLCNTHYIQTSQMAPLIWDHTGEHSEPKWKTTREKELFEQVLEEFIAVNIELLLDNEYEPICHEFDTDSGEVLTSYKMWVFGYLAGFRQWTPDTEKTLVDNGLIDFITMLTAAEIGDLEAAQMGSAETSEFHALICKTFHNAIKLKQTEFAHLEATQAAPTAISDEAKTNRNSPCPCGSGKKYKKCCLA